MQLLVFFFNVPAPTEIYTYGHTLSLHDALPISVTRLGEGDDAVSGELGTLNARRLADGFYRLRLTGRDISGRVSVTSIAIELRSGADKLGRYTDRKSTRLNSSH